MVLNHRFCSFTTTNKLVNEAANDSARVSGQDRKKLPALGTNQIAGFGGFRPLARLEKNNRALSVIDHARIIYLMCLYKAFYNHRNDLEISNHSYFIWGSRMSANFAITCPGYIETHYALSRVGLWKLQHFSQQRKVLRRISALWKIVLK